MKFDKHNGVIVDNAIYTLSSQKTNTQKSNPLDDELTPEQKYESNLCEDFNFIRINLIHYFTLSVLGIFTWGLLWFIWGDGWRWDGHWFKLAMIAIIAWTIGQIMSTVTTLPALFYAMIIGILARNLEFLDIRDFPEIDSFLRKLYPVIILGKGALGWDLGFMKKEWKQVVTLGFFPWASEVVATSLCAHYIIGIPMLWGIMLGSVHSSVSYPVILPVVARLHIKIQSPVNWPQLTCTAGGIDTALSVGIFGLIFSYTFYDTNDIYRCIKAAFTLVVGLGVGVAWGYLAKVAPHHKDPYLTPLRVLFLLCGGLFCNFLTSHFGWGGTGSVAVLACNSVAAMHWARDGWALNNNPAVTTYRVLWAACEPALFAFTATYFTLDDQTINLMASGLVILAICLVVRLTTVVLFTPKLNLREKLFLCCMWMTKSSVLAVLCPLALNALILEAVNKDDVRYQYAEKLMRFGVISILITTPLGYLLTKFFGPVLLKTDSKNTSDVITGN